MTTYNCECEESPYRTLGELQADLLVRLGFANPLVGAERRQLSHLRNDLLARLGFAAHGSMPPGMKELLDSFLNEAEQTLFRRLELDRGGSTPPARMVEDDDTTSLDSPMVFALALAAGKAHYGQGDAKSYGDTVEKMLQDYMQRRPPGVMDTLAGILQSAQEALYRRYDVLRTERTFRWQLQAGVSRYALADGNGDCPHTLDPRKVTWVGVERDSVWAPLESGIRPELYSYPQHGWPSRYSITDCVEVWPTPEVDSGVLRVRGHFGLAPFSDMNDRATIDDEPILLLALANAKAHYRQQDGQNYIAQLETLIAGLVAGTHQTRKYIPGRRRSEVSAYAIPTPSEPFH